MVTMASLMAVSYVRRKKNRESKEWKEEEGVETMTAEFLGFEEYIPSFGAIVASPQIDVSRGVNYASGGAGIRSETGYRLGERISLDEQLINHQFIISRLAKSKGNETREYLSKCLYTLDIASNDYINNYFAGEGYFTSLVYTPEEYATALITEYAQQIKTLYNSGARKFAIFALGSLGCTPAEILLYGRSNGSICVDKVNIAAQLFNDQLEPLVEELNEYFTDAKFVYVDLSGVSLSEAEGFTVTDRSCCDVGSDGMCIKDVAPCLNRSEYIFYDNFHTTEAVNKLCGASAYTQVLELLTFNSLLEL
ncbi:hypothetical protein Drorol1_Dr00005547 [Drosera rotundifolia]